MSNLYHRLSPDPPSQVLTYATTLSPQLLATADALLLRMQMCLAIQIGTEVRDATSYLPVYSKVKQAPPITAAHSPIVSFAYT